MFGTSFACSKNLIDYRRSHLVAKVGIYALFYLLSLRRKSLLILNTKSNCNKITFSDVANFNPNCFVSYQNFGVWARDNRDNLVYHEDKKTVVGCWHISFWKVLNEIDVNGMYGSLKRMMPPTTPTLKWIILNEARDTQTQFFTIPSRVFEDIGSYQTKLVHHLV